jgi:predicted site-specific integrase-resolvase
VRLQKCAEERPISVKTLRRYIAAGRITGYRFGPKIIMVDLNEIDAVLLKPIPTAGGGTDAA